MRSIVTAVVLFFVFSAVDAKPVPKNLPLPPKSDAELLQGDWKMVAFEQFGVPSQTFSVTLAIKGDQWRMVNADLQRSPTGLTFKVDPTKNPKTIDLIYTDKDLVSRGIYKFDGNDTLTMCRTTGNADRPTEFATDEQSGVLIVWKRDKK